MQLFPSEMQEGHPLWAALLLWAAAYYAGHVAEAFGTPRALGSLCAGFVLRNLPPAAHKTAALQLLSTGWSKSIRAVAIAIVLLKAGLGLDLSTVRAYGFAVPAMAVLPSLLESLVGAGIATALFDLPFLVAWILGFVCAAVGPAIVSSGCARAKQHGFSARTPNFLITSACFDESFCISAWHARPLSIDAPP